jgi:hypothetical protein
MENEKTADPGAERQRDISRRIGVKKMNWWRISKYTIPLAAGMSFLLSVLLWFTGSKEQGLFVGLWVPSILAFGAYVLALLAERRQE